LKAAIADPASLSSDTTFAETSQLYKNAAQIVQPGPRLTKQLDQLEKILAIAAQPVAVTLTSDAATEVTISQLDHSGPLLARRFSCVPGATSSSVAATAVAICVRN
jgi:hypothetical protein